MDKEFNQEAEISMEGQAELARSLSEAVDAREEFIDKLGGFDDFAEVHQYVGDNREVYNSLDDEVSRIRKELDEKVLDKKVLVDYLVSHDEAKLAARISRMFGVK
ncbi:hypothetical protein KW790_02805 [Candidatus Parcubacteria bacterium]|nr:hypothetical protein [Candidatus Parcubacteria bacterium]